MEKARSLPSSPSSEAPKFGLPKDKRIRKRKDYLRIGRLGQRFHGTHLLLVVRPAARRQTGRFGFTATKQVGPAHERNLVKRRLKHLARHHQQTLSSLDIIIIVKADAQKITFAALSQEFLGLCDKVLRFAAGRGRDDRKRG